MDTFCMDELKAIVSIVHPVTFIVDQQKNIFSPNMYLSKWEFDVYIIELWKFYLEQEPCCF